MVRREIKEISRSTRTRNIKPNIYVSCEGETEEAYLKGLKREYIKVATIKISNSKKTAAKDVVKNLKKQFKSEYQKEDLKYCIFDCDENSDNALKDAQELAQKEGATIIFSNPCFEVWLLWHFENDLSYQHSREALKRRIEDLIKPNYWKFKEQPNLYDLVKDNLTTAQMNYSQRKNELNQDSIDEYSRASNPYSNFDILIADLINLNK